MANYNYDFWAKEHEWKSGGKKEQELIGGAIDKTFAERRLMADRTRKEEDRQLKRNIMNYNMGKAIAKDMDDLTIMGDTSAGGLNSIITQGSREIADYAAHLTKELQRTGDYATYSHEMAKIKSEVNAMTGLKADVGETLTLFNEMNENDTLSNYVSADIRAALADMQMTNPKGKFQVIDGQQVWVGETVTGKPYQIAASEFKNLKNKLTPKANVDGILNDALKVQRTASGNILSFDQGAPGIDGVEGMSAADFAQDALDDLLVSRGKENRHRMLGATLVDKFGYSEDDVKGLLAQGWDKAKAVLDKEWEDQARSQYGVNSQAVQNYKESQQDQYEKYKEKLDNRKDVANTVKHLGMATWSNQDENDVISANYIGNASYDDKGNMIKAGERESNPEKWQADVKNSLIQKGFGAPEVIMEEGNLPQMPGMILDKNTGQVRPVKALGYSVVNEKLPQNRRTAVEIMFSDFDYMPNVWEKIYAANGVESFKAGAAYKDYTNDRLNQRQGRGVPSNVWTPDN